jgi:hypothetical protein
MDSAKVIQADGIPFLFDRFTAIGRYESLDTLLPDPLGTSPEPMIRFAEQREYRGKYPTAMSVLSWPAAR